MTPRPRRTDGTLGNRLSYVWAESHRTTPEGARETLRVTGSEVLRIHHHPQGDWVERLPLSELKKVQQTSRIRSLDAIVALAYLLAASVLSFALLQLMPSLAVVPEWALAGTAIGAATVAGLVFWVGREAVIIFVGRQQRIEFATEPEGHEADPASRDRP